MAGTIEGARKYKLWLISNPRTKCNRGHPWIKENVREAAGKKYCKICSSLREKKFRKKVNSKLQNIDRLTLVGELEIKRLWSRIRKGRPNDCWPWIGSGANSPPFYGTIKIKNILCLSHRVIAHVVKGPIPDGLSVLHSCDNPPCCNPRHLFFGTQAENIQDAVKKGRHPSQLYPGIRRKKWRSTVE